MDSILKKLNALYVEDDELTGTVLYKKLSTVFKSVYHAKEGAEALEYFQTSSPQIIITDLGMPVMDGYEFLDKIKEIDSDIPVIVVIAYTEENIKSIKADEVLFKPVRLKELISTLEEVAAKHYSQI